MEQRCDDIQHCLDRSDEANCTHAEQDTTLNETDAYLFNPPLPPAIVHFDGRGNFSMTTAVNFKQGQTDFPCPETHFQCPGDGYCLPVYVRCNGVNDCPGREDEAGCENYMCPGFYRCYSSAVCVHVDNVCDGWPQCPQHDDERFCQLTCPEGCSCRGLVFTCVTVFPAHEHIDLRYLQASGSGVTPAHLTHNLMLIHLDLSRCNLTDLGQLSLPNLLALDLSDNLLHKISSRDLQGVMNLRSLSLADNPLTSVFVSGISEAQSLPRLLELDLSGVKMEKLHVPAVVPFPTVQTLNLSQCGVEHVTDGGFQALKELRVLDIRGSLLFVFPSDLFKNLSALAVVYSDYYMLCCPLEVDRNVICRSPAAMKSCQYLLTTTTHRLSVSVTATLALIGNFGSLLTRALVLKIASRSSVSVFVTQMSVSDFLMGVCLAILAVADRLFLGEYGAKDAMWRNAWACQVAGFLAVLSGTVCHMLVSLITLDNLLSIWFPLNRFRSQLYPKTAYLASGVCWLVGFLLAVLPFLTQRLDKFYGQTSLCVPLPVSTHNAATHGYSVAVQTAPNLLLSLFIFVGQASIYWGLRSRTLPLDSSSASSCGVSDARRFLTISLFNSLCRLSTGLLGLLASVGVVVTEEVNLGMAVHVQPSVSALNPFLYLVNSLLERRRLRQEERLLKLLAARRQKQQLHNNPNA